MIRLSIFLLSVLAIFTMSHCAPIEPPVQKVSKASIKISRNEVIEIPVEQSFESPSIDEKKNEEITVYTDCENIQNKFYDATSFQITSEELLSKYKIISELDGAHSGAKVFLVEPADHKRTLVLKTLPPSTLSTTFSDNESLREVYFSCKLANLEAKDHIALGNASDFFPKLYDFGFTDSLDPTVDDSKSSAMPVPFIVMEFVNGMTLIDFVENSDQAIAKFGFDIDTAPKNFLVGILSQIAVALLNADRSFGFRHNDLHPGNIMLSTGNERITKDDITCYEGPPIKIIDFGSAFDSEHMQNLSTRLKHKIFKRREDRLIEHELKNSSAAYKMYFKNALAMRLTNYVFERDIRSLNFYLQTFSRRFKKLGFKTNRCCDDYDDCFSLIHTLTG